MSKDIDKSFLRDIVGETRIIDMSNPENYSTKIMPEKEFRKRLLMMSRNMGCEREMLMLFAKADATMRKCTDAKERKDMSELFCLEVYRILGGGGELVVNGLLICKDR